MKTVHSLVNFNQIKACGIGLDNSNIVTIMLIPLYDDSQNASETIMSLNHASYMIDYLYTFISVKKFLGDKHFTDELIDKMQGLISQLGYRITYKQPLIMNDELYSTQEYLIEKSDLNFKKCCDILSSKESLHKYITEYTWIIVDK